MGMKIRGMKRLEMKIKKTAEGLGFSPVGGVQNFLPLSIELDTIYIYIFIAKSHYHFAHIQWPSL